MPRQWEILVDLPARRRLWLLLLAAVIAVVALASVAWAAPGKAPAAASSTWAAAVPGSYYLTDSVFLGNEARNACAQGYHMASLWEILDVSNLRYDTVLGYQHFPGDCGKGPPTGTTARGWVRTGAIPSIGTAPGGGNCGVWTQYLDDEWGTVVWLPNNWSSPGSTMGVWLSRTAECSVGQRVWCVRPPFHTFLPLVLRNF